MKALLLIVFMSVSINKIICENATESDEADPETVQYLTCIQKYNLTGTEVATKGSYAEKCGHACAMKAKGMLSDDGEFIKDRMLLQGFPPNMTYVEMTRMQMAIEMCARQVTQEEDECEKVSALMDCLHTKMKDPRNLRKVK
ncbi:uncharacterized protein [Rhodnius prolixus]|uniref:Uncharacterized protein n=1 Tax=Rhodnius prolixus TaxID=13249 RepID=T1HD10_RHOPR